MWTTLVTDIERVKTNLAKLSLIVQSQNRIGMAPEMIKKGIREARSLVNQLKANIDTIDQRIARLEEKYK